MTSSNRPATYGPRLHAGEAKRLLAHQFLRNATERVTPLCIWGTHGIGKTELVQAFAREKGCELAYIAPAQFEEMGDLLGMPKIDGTGETTRFAPPEWAPRRPGPGILLIDDVNRADDRILRGVMSLLQFHRLVSWELPKGWMIVLTANPDNGDYSVTPMDEALLTRMIHISMVFDLPTWARWAEHSAIDARGIAFVLAYPELINEARTTPRSLVQFFTAIRSIPDLQKELPLVRMLAEGCLDLETAQAFANFVNLDLAHLLSPEEILYAADFEQIAQRIEDLVEGPARRLDILSVLITRLTNFLLVSKENLDKRTIDNLSRFILLPFIPNDLRLSMAQDLIRSGRPGLNQIYQIPEIGKLLLEQM